MKLAYILIIFNLLSSYFSWGQNKLVLQDLNHISCMNVDASGNFWVSDDAFTLYKFDSKGKLITNVNIKTYGTITSIDCANPFEIYVFHQDQNIIVFYDNMLNMRGEIRLNDYLFNNVSCVARSYDNHIWMMDLSEYKLLKINKSGKILVESIYLNTVSSHAIHPSKIWEEQNHVYVLDTSVGIYAFDIFSTYQTTFPIAHSYSATSIQDYFYINQQGKLISYHQTLRNPVPMHITLTSDASLIRHNNTLYYHQKNEIIPIHLAP